VIGDHFPLTRAAHPDLVHWEERFDWSVPLNWDAVGALLGAQARSAHESPAALAALSETLFRDLAAATLATADSPEQGANVDILRFLISLPVAASALIEGDHGLAYDWVLAGISRTFEFGPHINHGEHRLPPYAGGDPVGNVVAAASLIRWFQAFYAVSTKLGGLDGLARHYAPGATAVALGALGSEHRSLAVQLLALMGQWMAEHHEPQAPWFAVQLSAMFDAPGFEAHDRVIIGTALAGALAPYTGSPASFWARRLLAEQAHALVEHERVQITILAVDTVETWRTQRERLLADIVGLAAFYRDAIRNGGDAGVALEARVKILHPLFHFLAGNGSTDDIIDVLAAWYATPGQDRADPNILFVCPAYGDGTAYVWPGGRSLPAGDDPANLDRFLASLSLAHSQFFRGPAGDQVFALEEDRWGMPNHEHAPALRRDMAVLYDFERLHAALPPNFRPRALVIVPSHRDPIQAELADVLGWLAPIEASVAAAAPARPRQVISVWSDDAVQLVDAEVQLLRSLGQRGGWEVRVFEGDRTAEAFARYYEDPEPDMLWVISHGEMDAHDLSQSGIVLADRTLMPIRDVARLAVPEVGRRLLVLNICSGGAAQNRGGMGHLGLAQSLARAHQQVIAHQWPVDSYPALVFAAGFLLASINNGPDEALRGAAQLMRDIDGLRAGLAALDPDLSAIARLDAPAQLG
jgi:hypothetical protein